VILLRAVEVTVRCNYFSSTQSVIESLRQDDCGYQVLQKVASAHLVVMDRYR
jgi:hypothetical protein